MDTRYFGLSTTLKHTMDLHIDIEEESDEDDELKPEYVCPFCLEDFDLVGFCCHIDDGHPIEAKSGICPICAKKNLCNGGSRSTLSLLRRNSQDEPLQSFADESCVVSSSDMADDPLLSSLIYNAPPADEPELLKSSFTIEANLAGKSSDDNMLERNIHSSPLSNKDQEEKAQICEFVQGLLYSTILEDNL